MEWTRVANYRRHRYAEEMTARKKIQGTPERADELLERDNADGTVAVMRLGDEEHFYTIDGVAAEVWKLIDGNTSVDDIRKNIIERFNPPEDRFETDLAEFLGELQKKKLIRL